MIRLGPKHRVCRRVGQPLCGLPNCPALARPYPPGQFGARRRRVSGYYVRLLEKQKLRAIYGVTEKQLRRYVEDAARTPGVTGIELLRTLETRLDSLLLRLGFARTVGQARQLIAQGHVRVDGKPVKTRSFRVRPGQTIGFSPRAKQLMVVRSALEQSGAPPPYLQRDDERLEGKLLRLPTREEIPSPVTLDERLVIEYYAA